MTYQNFVEIGRVAFVHFGGERGKLVVILDVLNENRVLIENPLQGVQRQVIPIKRLSLTRFKVPITRSPKTGTLQKALEKFDLNGKWEKTSTAKKIALRTQRARLTDFDRFKTVVHRRRLAHSLKKHVGAALRAGKGVKKVEKKAAEPKKAKK